MDLDAVTEAHAAADAHLRELCETPKRFTMSIPARPDHDSDLVIGRALAMLPQLAAELRAARADAERLRNTDALVEAALPAVREALGGMAFDCTRVWSAWSYGTMTDSDFVQIADDDARVDEIARAAIDAARATAAEGVDRGA